MKPNKASSIFVFLIVLILFQLARCTFKTASITSRHSNQNYVTDYTFQFTTAYPYPNSNIRIGFPISYSLSAFQPQLKCFFSDSGGTYFRATKCWIQPSIGLQSYFLVGEVVVQVSNISQTSPYFILLQNVINPDSQGITPYFSLCVQLGTTLTECDYSFGRLPVNQPPMNSVNSATLETSPVTSVVGQSSSYVITTKISSLGSWYSANELMSVRLILPQQFSTQLPLCSIGSNLSSYQMTYLPVETHTFAGRSNVIQCSRIAGIQSFFSNGNSFTFRVQTIINPLQVGIWTNAYVQVVRSIHNEVVEVIPLSTAINIVVQQFTGRLMQTNNFRNSTNFYYFYLNHDVILPTNSSIQITIGNNTFWKIHDVQLISGFTSPNTSVVTIKQTNTFATITLENYGNATRKAQQIIGVNLTSPPNVGNQTVTINAFIEKNLVGTWTSFAYINKTYGQSSLLSLSAVRKKVKLPANATGSLQLTFFLNYELPESQGYKNGSIVLSVYPQLTQPNPDINGVMKCYFKGFFESSSCTMDNTDPTKTTLTILSPPLQAYQYSQIPIIITTEGAINQDNVGFPIDPLVTRYRFETAFYLYNSSTIPSEVFYSQWIADAIQMNSSNINIISLSHESNQETNVQITLNMPVLSPIDLASQLRLMVQFMADPITKINGWDLNLGYSSDRIYKEYPCIVTGLTGDRIRCDLYTYHNSPGDYDQLHINSDITGSFFIIYGFVNTIVTGTLVTIQLPQLKIGGNVNVPAWVKVSILSQTPAQLQPFVQLYFKNITAFTTLPSNSIVPTVVPSSQSVLIGIQSNIQYNITWSPNNPALVKYIKYEINQTYFPSFLTTAASCTANTCFSAGLPANWIVQKPASVTAPYSMQTILSIILTSPYLTSQSQTIPVNINTYDGTGKTLEKVMMFLTYTPQQLIGYYSFAENIVYGGLEQWYSVSFMNSFASVSTYPFIRVTLDSNMDFSTPVQCNSSTILPFNETGLIYTAQSQNSILVWNMKQLIPGSTYQMFCKMRTVADKVTTSLSPTLNVEVHHNYTVGNSYVAVDDAVLLKQSPIIPVLGIPKQFTIENPQVTAQQLKVNYVGPLFIDFVSQFDSSNYASLTNLTTDLKIVLSNHRYNKAGWTTPTASNSDPPVCFVNNKRYSCSWSNNPLTVTIYKPDIIVGTNKVEITSEYVAPENGVKCPGAAGNYLTTLSLIDSSSTTVATHSFFIKVFPPDLKHLEASSIVKDIGTESIYIVNFTVPIWSVLPNSYNHASNYSRIFIEFPTKVGNEVLFQNDLGGYTGLLNERVGCSFVSGGQYVIPIAVNVLECRLIPIQVQGGNVRVEIINHNGFTAIRNSLALYIFKVFNPISAYRSFDLTITIQQTQVGTGYIYPLYSSKYTVFLDPYSNNSAPNSYASVDNDMLVTFFDPLLDVGDYGAITLTAQAVSGNPLTAPYYVIYKLPAFLNPQNSQIAAPFKLCPISGFQLCLTAPDIQYVVVKALLNPQTFQVFIKNYPISISQTDTVFQALVIQSGRLTGKIIYKITAAFRWKSLTGAMTFNSVQTYGLTQKLDLGRRYCEILVSFTTRNYIPADGTIQIIFPASITAIYPDCRSATSINSNLFAASGSPSGQVGCMIQNTNHWVITSFLAVNPSTTVIIRGFIDLPNQSGTIGVGQIISYSDNHPTNIYLNGSRIDYVQADFGLIVSNTSAMNINPDIFMTQRSIIRQGYVGQFRLVFTPNSDFTASDYLQLSLYKNDIKGNSGGFQLTLRPKVCEFMQLNGQDRIGCIVLSQTQTVIFMHEGIVYQIMPVQTLLSSQKYELRLTSQDYIYPEGIQYPTVPSTYKIDILINHTATASIQLEQRYIEIFGQPFTFLSLTQFSYDANTYNPFWLILNPAITIQTSHQIIIQFPTLSNDGINLMFSNDLGYTTCKDGDWIPTDIFDCGFNNGFMDCRIFFGDYLRSLPTRIVCGNFLTPINPGQTLKFAFAITNPPQMTSIIQSQISLPVFVYSFDPYLFQKINYNTINVGAYVNNAKMNSTPSGFFSTTTNQKDMPNQNLFFANHNANSLQLKDAYVIKFAFPIRVNGKYTSACQNVAGTVVYGDAYYHQNLRTVICLLIYNPLPANVFPTTATFRLKNFYTPWYTLTLPQLKVEAIATYFSSFTSSYIRYFDFFPTLQPRYSNFAAASILSLSPILPHTIACQRNDYLIQIQLQNTTVTVNSDLKYTKMIMLQIPQSPNADYDVWNSDCVEHHTSTVQIIQCQVLRSLYAIVITIQPGNYLNNRLIAIQTKGLAIRNPCVLFTGASNAQWTAYFLSFENNTAFSPNTANAYLTIKSLNMLPTTMGFINQSFGTYYYTYDWFEVPHERYFNQFRQYDVGQYSPFSFEIFLFNQNVAAPAAGSFNKLTLTYGAQYLPCGIQTYSGDLSICTPVCYLMNNRIHNCVVDQASNTTYMKFNFALPKNTSIHVYFSTEDPRDSAINGYEYVGSDDVSKLSIALQSGSTTYLFETSYFQPSQTQYGTVTAYPVRGISSATINYATTQAKMRNIFDMQFQMTRPDLTALKFQIPMVDPNNQPIFGPTYANSFFSLSSGDEYPCGCNQVSVTVNPPKCYIYYGDFDYQGTPTQIIMTGISQSATFKVNARFIFNNPSITGEWITVNVKAYTGTIDQNSLYGLTMIGFWNFNNVFQVTSKAASLLSCPSYPYWYITPNKNTVWRQFTSWTLSSSIPSYGGPIAVGDYVIYQLPIYTQDVTNIYSDNDEHSCVVNFQLGLVAANLPDDYMYVKQKNIPRSTTVFFVKQWQPLSTSLTINYYKCKHYVHQPKVQYSRGKSILYAYEFPINSYTGWPGYYQNWYSNSYGDSVIYMSPTTTKTLIEIDLTPSINNLLAQQFVWDNNTDYLLEFSLSYSVYGITGCRVVQGVIDGLNSPTCTPIGTTILIGKFSEIIINNRLSSYRVKLEIFHSGWNINQQGSAYDGSIYFYWSGDARMWAGPLARANNWFLFWSQLSGYYSSFSYYRNEVASYCSSQWTAVPMIFPYRYNYFTTTKNLNVNLLNVGTNAAMNTLQLHLNVTPTANIPMNRKSGYDGGVYMSFRFKIVNYKFICGAFSKFIVTYRNGGYYTTDPIVHPSMISCVNNEIKIDYYYWASFGSIWGVESNSIDTGQSFEFDIQLAVIAEQAVIYRDWVGIQTYIDAYQFYYISCYVSYCCWSSVLTDGFPYQDHNTVGFSQNFWTSTSLFNSVSIQLLSTNIDQPTELSVTMNYATIGLGQSKGKKLLLQLNNNNNPFAYINDTTVSSQIECICTSDWNPTSTGLLPTCIFRPSTATNVAGKMMNSAIIVDLQIVQSLNARCYFPEWTLYTGPLFLTAKAINDHGGITTDIFNYTINGAFLSKASNIINIVSVAPSLLSASLTQTSNPSIYSPKTYVNTYLNTYALVADFNEASTQPIIYVDFQKAGIKPDAQFCTKTFFIQCRVYNRFRQILVAQYLSSWGSNSNLNLDSNYAFFVYLPKHQESGINANYTLIFRVIATPSNYVYTHIATKNRDISNLLPTNVSMWVIPEPTTGTYLPNQPTNLLISFALRDTSNPMQVTGQYIYSYFANKFAQIEITCNDTTILSNSAATTRGCLALSQLNQGFELDCFVDNTNKIIIRNLYIYKTFTTSGLIHIVVGIVNPTGPVLFTVTGYEYQIKTSLNYGISFTGSAAYTPLQTTGQTVMMRGQLKMYPFFTKIYSATQAPLRIAFKLSSNPPLPSALTNYPSEYLFFVDQWDLPLFTNYQCLIRGWSRQPNANPQSPFFNSYRSYKQRTQHTASYVNCYFNAGNNTALVIDIPHDIGLDAIYTFYELVIMPVTSTVTGFPNQNVPWFKLMALPSSCEYIGKFDAYMEDAFDLNFIYLVTTRPQYSNGLFIQFNINFNQAYSYPQHYLEVIFKDLDLSAMQLQYQTPGATVPCTLSAFFTSLPARIQKPHCVVSNVDLYVNTILIRVSDFGNIITGTYTLTLDDFLLPDMTSPLQDTSPFRMCISYSNIFTSVHYQRCFGQLFTIDKFTDLSLPSTSTDTLTISNSTFGVINVIASLSVSSYPMNSLGSLGDKLVMQMSAGYSSTTAAPINMIGFPPLWFNPNINYYVYKQSTISLASNIVLQLKNLTNPQVYQKGVYGTPTLSLKFYGNQQPRSTINYTPPPFSSFALQQANVFVSNVLYYDDVKLTIPENSWLIYRTSVVIIQSAAAIITKQLDKVVLTFSSNVTAIDRCWVFSQTLNTPYQLDGACQTISSQSIAIYRLNDANINNNLTLFIRMKLSASQVSYTTTVYSQNGEVQYLSSGSQTFLDIDNTRDIYSFLDFTENVYTSYYYEQAITQLPIATSTNYLYLSLNLPKDLTYGLTVFTIYLNAFLFPNNCALQTRLICEWLISDQYGRRYITGQFSICTYGFFFIKVQAPFGSLPRLSATGQLITYLLKIREFDPITTSFTMPSTTNDNEFRVSHANGAVLNDDSFTIYPFRRFPSGTLSLTTNTLTASELATYTIRFTPSATVPITKQAILQLDFDTRYFPADLGMAALFASYGIDVKNQTYINFNGLNIAYKTLPNIWVNGLPYSGHTLTPSQPQQTSIHSTISSLRAVMLLQTSYIANAPYQWKIPLLMNPTLAKLTYRLNLTLYNYISGTARPQKVYFNEIINPFYTQSNSSSDLNYTLTAVAKANTVQSTTATLSVNYGFPFVPDITTQVQFKITSRNQGIIQLIDFVNGWQPDSTYSYCFFQRVNLLLADKKINDGSTLINLGALEKTNKYVDYFGFDWVKVHSITNYTTIWNAGQQLYALLPCTVGSVTATVVEGVSSAAGSQFLLQMVFVTPCALSINSTFAIQFDWSMLDWNKDYECYTSFRSLGCFYSNGSLNIAVNEPVGSATSVSIAVYFISVIDSVFPTTTLTGFVYAIPSNPSTIIDNFPSLAIMPPITPSMTYSGFNQLYTVRTIYENTWMKLRGTIVSHYTPLTYIDLLHPFSWTALSHHRFLYALNNTQLTDQTTSLHWIGTKETFKATNLEQFALYPAGIYDYSIITSKSYSFILESTYDPSYFNNMSVGVAGTYYEFTYRTDSQIQNEEVYPQPVAIPLIILNPTLQISFSTAIGVRFITNKQINVGDIIHLKLDSHNLIDDMYGFGSILPQCQQGVKGILTSSVSLVCDVQQYAANKDPLIIRVYPTKVVAINTQIQIWISPVLNPSKTIVAGAIVTITRECGGQQRCPLFEARGHFKTVSNIVVTDYVNTTATFTTSNTEVLKQNVQHSYTFSSSTCSAAIIDYPQNYDNIMTQSCSFSGGQCIVFPKQKRVVVIVTTPVATPSLSLLTMNNGMYVNPISQYINLTVCSSTALDLYNVYHNNLTTITKNYVSTLMNYMTITPTQSPNLFLRNYLNTAIIQLYGLYTDPYIKAFYINAPKDVVTWDSTYCNATLASNTNNPYPTRLNCQYQNDTTIAITIPEGVTYQSGITDYFLVTVNCKFQIVDFTAAQKILYISTPVISGPFNAYGSFSNQTNDYHYYITQATTTISISQLEVPPIGNIQFVTQAYQQRLANINDTASLDLLFDPTTPQPIAFIELQIPQGFSYPPVGSHDACSLVFWSKQPIDSCQQIRNNAKTIIRMVPPAGYANGPALIHIKNTNESNWFTAPRIPGNWYNFTLSLYSANGTLLERDYNGNCTAIGGLDLDLDKIVLQNGRDAQTPEIVDLTFTIGRLPIYKGYDSGLLNGQFYTQINIGFENWHAFDNLIDPSNTNGSLVGCVTQGLPYIQQIKCLLEGGSTIEDQPIIRITGYEWIPPNSTITISLANVFQLNSTTRNTLSVSVLLKQVGSWKQGQLYNPQQIVLKQTGPLTASSLAATLSYVGITLVGQPKTLQLTITPTVDITSYIVIKLPEYFLNRQYKLFNPNCTTASKIQLFYRSDIVRIYPLGGVHLKNTNLTYTITGFPSSQYSVSFGNWPITIEAYSAYKQVNKQALTMSFQSLPCNLNLTLSKLSSPYSYDQNVFYIFQVNLAQTNITFTQKTVFAVIFPSDYSSLLEDTVSCTVTAPLICQLTTKTTVLVTNLAKYSSQTFDLNISGITNPVSGNRTYILQTYQGKNTDQIQCKGQTSFVLRKSTPRNCSLSVNVSHLTLSQAADYSFTLLCNQAIRNQSDIRIALPLDYSINNPPGMYSCWSNSNPLNLQTSICPLVYQNATFYLVFPSINVNYNQISISFSAQLKNPPLPHTQSLTALLSIKNQSYGASNKVNVTMASNIASPMTGISLSLIPNAAGANSIYILQMPSKYVKKTIQVELPGGFKLDEDLKVSFYWSNNTKWLNNLSYFDVLQQSYKNSAATLISTRLNLHSKISVTNITIQPTYWVFVLIKFIQNPSYVDKSQRFTVLSLDSSKILAYSYSGPLSSLGLAAGGIHFIDLKVLDNDLGMLTTHNLTYRVDQQVYTNLTSIVITPPQNNPLYALSKLDCCLYVRGILIECHSCQIGKHQIQFLITTNGLSLQTDDNFTLQINSLFTSSSINNCQAMQGYQSSYFKAMIFRNGTQLTHQSLDPSADDFTPCTKLIPKRGNIDITVPNVLYAGMSYELQIGLGRPSKMVRVILNSTSPFLSFSPVTTYINSYDIPQKSAYILVSPTAIPSSAYINITHQQSIVYSLFRYNLPQLVQIRNDRIQYIEVLTTEACSIGLWVEVPILLTWPASTDIYVNFVADNTSVVQFEESVVLVPATSNQSFFRFRTNGTVVPSTLPVTLTLQSATILKHQLRTPKIYFYFSVTQQFQTLPPVLKVKVSSQYQNNSQFAGKQIYNKFSSGILYDQLAPSIIAHYDGEINSTWANIQIFTRHQSWAYYVLIERGNSIANVSASTIKMHKDAKRIITARNTTQYVNAYCWINFTRLAHQTIYDLYAMASNSLGDSVNYTVHRFMTTRLSNAVQLRIDTNKLITVPDSVYFVHSISDALNIDIIRVKVVDSYILVNQNFGKSKNFQNQLLYRNKIVVSPSTIDDKVNPLSLVTNAFLKNESARVKLKSLMPQFIDNIKARLNSTSFQDRPLIQLVISRPYIKNMPSIKSISYYHVNLTFNLRKKGVIYAVAVQTGHKPTYTLKEVVKTKQIIAKYIGNLTDQIPYSKQIIHGLDSYNQKLSITVRNFTDKNGDGWLSLGVLKPGTTYTLYLAYTTQYIYQPILYAQTANITTLQFFTLENPNIKHNSQALVLEELKQIDPEMYQIIKSRHAKEQQRGSLSK